ncbi:MAG: acyltransferase family protein [Myxococcota bacterium]
MPHQYRPELDGIRALAVIAVLIFHLHHKWLPGGFVGVDVFFVLSGYLITGLLRRSAKAGTFRYTEFFLRRVRRLTPPLLAMLCMATAGAIVVLPPATLVDYAASLWWQPVALQNMHFLAVGDYFDSPETKPLLHTWSLGVEEQFYLVWPFLIAFAARFDRKTNLALLAVVAFTSWLLCIGLPALSPKAGFYLFPARAWELCIGGALAVTQEEERNWSSRLPPALVGWLGMAVLAGSFVLIDDDSPFPGWRALLPAFGTGAVLLGCTPGSALSRALSARPLVLVGLGSYALYLWHWPLIVFAGFAGFPSNEPLKALALCAASGVGAYLSYRFVEEPIRRRRVAATTKQLFGGLGVVTAGLLAVAAAVDATRGFETRYEQPRRAMLTAPLDAEGDERCGFLWRVAHPLATVCQIGGAPGPAPGVMVWGNSHAAMWTGMLAELATDRPVYLNAHNCRPYPHSGYCDQRIVDSVLASLHELEVRDVVLASNWYTSKTSPEGREKADAKLSGVVQRLVDEGFVVWLVIDTPSDVALDPVLHAQNTDGPNHPSSPRENHREILEHTRQLFARLSEHPAVHVIDPTDDFCDASTCRAGEGTEAWYRDSNHLTASGARRARHRFEAIFR